MRLSHFVHIFVPQNLKRGTDILFVSNLRNKLQLQFIPFFISDENSTLYSFIFGYVAFCEYSHRVRAIIFCECPAFLILSC